jgi:hypothetical protein
MRNGNVFMSVRFKEDEFEVDLNVDSDECQNVSKLNIEKMEDEALVAEKKDEYAGVSKTDRSEHFVNRLLDVGKNENAFSDEMIRVQLTRVLEDILIDLKYYDVVTTHRSITSRLSR